MYVLHNPFVFEWNLSVPSVVLADNYRKELARSRKEIDAVVRTEQVTGLKIRELAREGDPTGIIPDGVRQERIDLLPMTAHEKGRLEHLIFGRSYNEIIRRLPGSILLVKRAPAVFSAVC